MIDIVLRLGITAWAICLLGLVGALAYWRNAPPASDIIAFVSNHGGNNDIYLL